MIYSVSASDGSTQNYTANYANISIHTAFGYGQEFVGTRLALTSLILPNGQSYTFAYDSYGSLTNLGLPTGATVAYTWANTPTSYSFGMYRYVTSRMVTVNGVSSQWTFSSPASLNCQFGNTTATCTQITVTDPLGNQSVYSQSGGLVTQVQLYSGAASGTPLRTYNIAYTAVGSDSSGLSQWLPQTVSTQLENGQTNQIAYTYDSYNYTTQFCPDDLTCEQFGPSTSTNTTSRGNVSEIDVYDWGAGSPGALIRKIVKTYLHDSFPAYVAANIVDKVLTDTTYNSSGVQVAQTQFEYDNYVSGDNPLISTSGAASHSSVGTLRGNVTRAKRWRNTDGALLTGTYSFDDLGNVRAVKDPLGHSTSYDYTDSFANSSCLPPTGQSGQAYVSTVTNALGQQGKLMHFPCTGLVQASKDQNDINAARPGTTFSYDILGRLAQKNAPDGGQVSISYNDVPPASVTSTTKITSTANLVSTAVMDGLGRSTQTQLNSDPDCPSSDKTDTTYDPFGRVASVSNPYCVAGEPTSGLTTYSYDALGRTTQVTHPDNSTILTSYSGRATQVQDEGNGTQRVARISQVDGLGRLASLCEVAPGPFIGAGGNSSSSLIGGSSGTPAVCGQDIAGTGFLTKYQYDTLDNLLQVNQSGIAPRTFTYDSLSRLLTAFNPESGSISYSYDANGNLSTKTAPAPNQTGSGTITATYQYDALNRLTQKSYNDTPQTPTVTFTFDQGNCSPYYITCYNLVGRLFKSAVGSNTYAVNSYDPMGRIIYQAQGIPNANNSSYLYGLPYTYDLMGNMTFGGTGQYGNTGGFTYAYNTAARLTGHAMGAYNTYTADLSGVHYDAAGRITSDTLGNGETESWTYSKRGWSVSSTSTLNGTNTYSYNITSFAPNGDILTASDSVNGNWTYSYDPFNRLVGSNKNSGQAVYSYVYDRFGNRWQQNGPNSMQLTFTGNNPSNPLNNNRMDGYTYDAAGNLLNDGTHQYFYDAENRLAQVDGTLPYCSSNGASGTAATACYFYDANGYRVRNTGAGDCAGYYGLAGGLGYTYDLSGRWITTVATDANNDGPCHYEVYVGGRHLFHSKAFNAYSHADWLGTERARVCTANCGGYNQDNCTSLPFGDGLSCTYLLTSAYVSDDHFTGKERDFESGLDNFGARYDSSSTGRFMSPDPLLNSGRPWEPQSWNRYAYARNNPLNIIDPTGLYDLVNNCAQDDKKCNKQFRQHADDLKNGLKNLQDQLKNVKDPEQKARLEAALKAIGTEGDHNGVNVNFGATQGGGAGETVPVYNEQTGKVGYNVTFDPNMLKGETGYAIAGAHEGTHIDDISNPLYADPKTTLSDFSLEYRGYQTSAFAASALGRSSFSANYDGRSYLIWNGSWAAVDKNITNFVTQFHDQKGKPNHLETTPHNPWPN